MIDAIIVFRTGLKTIIGTFKWILDVQFVCVSLILKQILVS